MNSQTDLPDQPISAVVPNWWVWGLLLAAILLYGMNLGNLPLHDWDEATYAIAARGMVTTGDWLHPTQLGDPYLNKPPLGLWMIASSYRLFGVSEWSTRLPMALTSALAVPLLFLIGRAVFPSPKPALLSSLVYLTWLPVARHGRWAMLDGSMISLCLLMLLCYLYGRKQPVWLWGMGLCFGIMALLKGVLAVLLASICLGILVLERNFRLLRHPYVWFGLGLGLLPGLVWYWAQGNHYGPSFWQVHFFNQAINRAWDAVQNNSGPPWFYLLEVLKSAWPWLPFLPLGAWLTWQHRQQPWGKLALLGSILYFLTISVMRTKLPWYVMPVYPFWALMVGAELADWHTRLAAGKSRGRAYLLGWFALLTLVGIGAGVIYAGLGNFWLVGLGVAMAVTFAVTSVGIYRYHPQVLGKLFAGVYGCLLILFLSPLWLWEVNEAFPVKSVGQLILTQVPIQQRVVYMTFDYGRPSLNFYSQHLVLPLNGEAPSRYLSQKHYLLVDQETLSSLAPNTYRNLGKAEAFTLIQGK